MRKQEEECHQIFLSFSVPSPTYSTLPPPSIRLQGFSGALDTVQKIHARKKGTLVLKWVWGARKSQQRSKVQLLKVAATQSKGRCRRWIRALLPQLPGLCFGWDGRSGRSLSATYQVEGGLQEEKHVPAGSLHPPASQTSLAAPSLSLCSFKNIDPPDIHFTEQGALSAA